MNPHAFIKPPHDGEVRRVVALRHDRVGTDAIVTFGDLARPGVEYTAIVFRSAWSAGLAVADECEVRYRAGTSDARPARWELVRRLGAADAALEAPCDAPAGREALA